MSVREIVEVAGDRLPTKSKTPDTVVARDLSMDIKKRGADSKFTRTAPGRYTMRELVESQGSPSETTSITQVSLKERAGTKPSEGISDSQVSQTTQAQT